MIKKFILVCFMINACSYISYSDAIPLIKNAVIGVEDIEINKEFIDQKEFSFAKFKMGRSGIAILTLAYINNGIYEWVSATNEKIYTFNGKIIKTEGLVNNINILNIQDLLESSSLEKANLNILVNLTNPSAVVEHTLQYTLTDRAILEKVTIPSLNKNFVNYYYFNELNGRIVRTSQYIHPRLPRIDIDFYYK